MSNLALRIATASLAIPLTLLVNGAGGMLLAAVLAVVACAGALEMCGMLQEMGLQPITPLAVTGAAGAAAIPLMFPVGASAWAATLVFVLLLGGAVDLLELPSVGVAPGWVSTLGPVAYVGVLLGYLGLLRVARDGAWWVVTVLLATWAYDTGAYFAGSFWGSRPFMQQISSKKTVEGVIGGLTLSCVAALISVPTIGLMVWQALVLGLVVGAVAQTGDLVESALKRRSGVKDSGTLVPGHGGVLDRIDSVLFTGAATYYMAVMLGYAS